MKKFFIILFTCFGLFSQLKAQNFSFTIKPGSTATSVKVYTTSNADITGVASQILIAFSLPVASTPAGDPTFVPNASFSQWGAFSLLKSTEPVDGANSTVYNYFAAPATSTTSTFSNGAEVLIGEITFPDGTDLNGLKAVSLPDGGVAGTVLFVMEIGGQNKGNGTALFYGSGAVNSASGYSGLSYLPFTQILPVKFISFYALKSGDAAKLTWTVNDDANNEYFQVERSLDGRKYANLTRVEALANGKDINTYTATDPVLSKQGAKSLYYRIKQVDRNGASVYSLVRILNVDNNIPLSLYPNPARTITKLVLDAPQAGKAAIILRDAAGKQVQLINMQLVKGINQKDLNVNALPSGDYNVTLVSEGLTQTIKLSKLN